MSDDELRELSNQYHFITDDGEEIEYEKLCSFRIDDKFYIIFTDNTKDEKECLNTYAYYFTHDDTELRPVEDEMEIKKVTEVYNTIKEAC